MKKLNNSVIEKLKYYVYVLIDPINDKVFYIGKGKGNRIYSHINGILKGEKKSDKIKLITDITSKGYTVKHFIIRHGLNEKEALEVEGALIDFYGKKNLTNIVGGHNSEERGIMDINEIIINYDSEDALIDDKVILININNLYYFGINENELYEATRKSWRIKIDRANKSNYVLSHYNGIVREVYKIKKWYINDLDPRRIQFEGEIANLEIRNKYLHKSIKKYFKKGSQNPIKYINI